MGSQQLDNQMKEQPVKCEDFESYEKEIQHLKAGGNSGQHEGRL